MQLYFGKQTDESIIELSGDESHHCKNVMRMKVSDDIKVTDGQGNIWVCTIASFGKETTFLNVVEHHKINSRANYLHVAISPTKNIDRFEWFLEKATEFGIEEITPLFTTRTERSRLNKERLQKVIVSAMKQSQQAWLPKLNELVSFDAFVKTEFADYQKIICHANDSTPIKGIKSSSNKWLVLIGPEGDFTDAEMEQAKQQEFESILLGHNRLRTETAGVGVCAYLALNK